MSTHLVATGMQVLQKTFNTCRDYNCKTLGLTDPKVVEVSDDLLELDGDVDVDVLVEARLDRTELGQRREVVGAN